MLSKRIRKRIYTAAAVTAAVLLLLALPFALALLPAHGYDCGYSPEQCRSVRIAGHRGGAHLGNENTLSCFAQAIELGVDLECDIHETRDGQLIICHDFTLDRVTDGHGNIGDFSAAELQQLHFVDRDGCPTDDYLPLLSELLELDHGQSCLYIEIKAGYKTYPDIEQKLVNMLHQYNAQSWVIIDAQEDYTLERVHQLDPTLRLEKLARCKLWGLPLLLDATGLTWLDYDKYDYLAGFQLYYLGVSPSVIDDMHRHGKSVRVWTPEDPDHMPTCLDVDGVIVNRPDLWLTERADALSEPNDRLNIVGDSLSSESDSLLYTRD